MALALAGCGDTATSTNPDLAMVAPLPDMTTMAMPDLKPSFVQPAGTVAVSFSVDDSANKVYTDGDLAWKGAMIYEPTTRTITSDDKWGGPFAPLYDDGPWNQGGHEPNNAVAGDHKWGIVVFGTPPTTATQDYAYGLNDAVYATKYKDAGWLWPPGDNGKFTLTAGDTTAITAAGRKFLAFGGIDLQLTIDTKNLADGTWDLSKVNVKSDSWQWGFGDLVDDGTGKFTFTLSSNIGGTKPLNHSGLVNSGDKPQFKFVLGATFKEYADGSGNAYPMGVTAAYKPAGGNAFMPLTVGMVSNNSSVTIP